MGGRVILLKWDRNLEPVDIWVIPGGEGMSGGGTASAKAPRWEPACTILKNRKLTSQNSGEGTVGGRSRAMGSDLQSLLGHFRTLVLICSETSVGVSSYT